MNKPVKIAIAALLSGTLLTGIGAGVAFAEYSSMRLETVEAPDAAEPITLTETFSIPEDCKVRFDGTNCTITPDESIPVNTVSITATSLKEVKRIDIEGPFLEEERIYDDSSYYGDSSYDEYSEYSDGIKYRMEKVARFSAHLVENDMDKNYYKDKVLNGLKEGVIYDFPGVYDGFSVEARMNPADLARVIQ